MKRYDEVEFLNAVLSIPSVNGKDDEGNLARFLCTYLKECGVDAMVQEIDKKHANVVAVLEGKTKEKVIWNGHLDTVPYGKLSEWSTDPTLPVKKNGCIYARGASDMKSGLAAMVYALGNMKQKDRMPKQTIYFFGTCDEEKNGLGATKILEEELIDEASLLLIGEPTSCKPGVAGKGCVWLRLKVQGKTSHGAYPEQGINAIDHAINVSTKLQHIVREYKHPILGQSTAQITMLQGGIVPNMTPDTAELVMDIRTVPGLDADMILQFVKEVAAEVGALSNCVVGIEASIDNNRSAIELDLTNPWLKKVESELRREQCVVQRVGINYFTDASIFVRGIQKVPVLLLGPGEPEVAHKPNEYVEIKKYQKYLRILSRLFI